ncbi:phosphatase PAP2 family protein [Mycolicibacterium parafortuitum]|uniref:Phosphoesterase PA-phosphatase related protein [Kribbella flavida DSM] n=1 Tax=Mycolicibacterium parafortuitum TaxID=39692 RepID=A0A375YC29_MYCPF|nr:phosphatase PAP2 family protein [Mycolicibacterium parafortuitum]SRX78651.1 phosphoesterase PA-phosphatase related protein [Kribbella flavida DSM] [Mycolicibacterium parafortuitum]
MTRSRKLVVVAGDRRLRGARFKWAAVLVFALLFGAAVYLLAVRTTTGQRLEDAALRGSDQVDPELHRVALEAFHTISVTSQLGAAFVVALIGLLRRQVLLAVAGVGVILGGQAVTQVLKYHLLTRPDLAATDGGFADNTLPSGHTTAAMCLLFATLIVMPYRFRGVAMFVTLTWAVGIGAYTVIIGAHRLSDTLAANAVALVVASTASLLLARTGRIRAVVSPEPHRYTLRTIFVVLVGVVGAASLALGVVQTVLAASAHLNDEPTAWRLFLSSQWLAAAGSIAAALLFWWTWYRLETKRRHDPVSSR